MVKVWHINMEHSLVITSRFLFEINIIVSTSLYILNLDFGLQGLGSPESGLQIFSIPQGFIFFIKISCKSCAIRSRDSEF